MTWPTSAVNTSNVNSDSDSAAAARADIYALFQAVNDMIGHGGDLPGMIRVWAGMSTPAKYLPCNGSTRSRASFPDLFAAITKTVTVSTTNGSSTVTVGEDLTGLLGFGPGCPVSGAMIPAGTLVSDVTATTLKLSANATATASGVSLLLAPWGVGDGSTTFDLPDLRARAPIGVTATQSTVDLYRTGCSTTNRSAAVTLGSSSTLISVGMSVYGAGIPPGATVAAVSGTSVTLSANATATGTGLTLRFAWINAWRVGATGGAAQHTLSTAEMPSHTHDASGKTDRTTAGSGSEQVLIKNGTANALAPAVNATGEGLAHNNVQPSAVVNYIIRY